MMLDELSKRIQNNMRLAIRQAKAYEHDHKFHLATVIYKGPRVISVGYNYRFKTHPKSSTPYHRIHAELDAILNAAEEKLKGASMCIARVGHSGRSKIVMSRPCRYCQSLIAKSGMREVYYTIEDEQVGKWNVIDNKWEK